ncbi:hypothetical protein ISCGN_002400 [Ixodes scapularis]
MQEAQTSAAHRQSPLTFAKLHVYYATRVRTPAVSGQRSGGPPNSLEPPLSLCRSKHPPPSPPIPIWEALVPLRLQYTVPSPFPISRLSRAQSHTQNATPSLKVLQSKRPLQLLPPNVTRPPLRISFWPLTEVPSKFLLRLHSILTTTACLCV